MQIKRFEAKNMTEALRQIKRELGSEAVILSAKDLRREHRLLGISRKIGVEVTAAVDDEAPGGPSYMAAAQPMALRNSRRQSAADAKKRSTAAAALMHTVEDRVHLKGSGERAAMHPAGGNATDPASSDRQTMDHNADARSAFAAEMASALKQTAKRRPSAGEGLTVGALQLEKRRPLLVALVGNAGVGKTTTIAKLAARYTYRCKETVGLLALDDRRVGAVNQVRIYADSMALPFAVVRHANDVPRALKQLKACRLILIDCPAVDPADAHRLAALRSRLQALGRVTALLTLSAECREADLQDAARRCARFKPSGVIVTKTDLTRSCTDVANFLCREGLPVFFISHGDRVPFDLSPASLEELSKRLFKEGRKTSSVAIPRADDRPFDPTDNRSAQASLYLANKSSDIFHRPGCKWIRLINQTNIVEFDSFAEALNHRFKPCRYCNPQHISIAGLLSEESAAL